MLLSAEDGLADPIRPRLDAVGGGPPRKAPDARNHARRRSVGLKHPVLQGVK
jgi:hypothetical protein